MHRTVSERDHGARKACSRLIEKAAHAPCLRALKVDQPHLPPLVVAVGELRQKAFVAERIAFEPGNAILDRAAECKTDFESVMTYLHRRTSRTLRLDPLEDLDSLKKSEESAQGFPVMADITDESCSAPDYDVTELV